MDEVQQQIIRALGVAPAFDIDHELRRRVEFLKELLKLARDVLRDAARDDTLAVVAQAPSREAGLSLLLASPEFNRR